MRRIAFLVISCWLVACGIFTSDVEELEIGEISNLDEIASYIERRTDDTHDLLFRSIEIPNDLDTVIWDVYGIDRLPKTDSIWIQYYLFRQILEEFVEESLNSQNGIRELDLVNAIGEPNSRSKIRDGVITELHYFFNRERFPNCRTVAINRESHVRDFENCSTLSFILDREGMLSGVNSNFLHP